MPTDSKGVYYDPSNRGFATILKRAEEGSFFDSALNVAKRRKQEEAQKRDDILKMLTPDDVWAPYSESANNILLSGVESLASGDLDRAGAMKLAVQYKTAQDQAKGMQELHTTAITNYAKDSRIDENKATEWRWGQAVGDGSIDFLKEALNKGVDDVGFLNEFGGSQYLNDSEVVTYLVDNLRTTLEEFETDETKEYYGPGGIRYTSQKIKELRNQAFTRVPDPENGNQYKLVLKDAQTLKNEGLLDSFMEDPYFNRMVQDALWEESGRERTTFRPDEIEQKAMQLINLYGSEQQELTVTEQSETARYTPSKPEKEAKDSGKKDSGKKGEGKMTADESMALWYEHLMSGDPALMQDAASYLVDTREIESASLAEMVVDSDKSIFYRRNGRLRSGANEAGLEILNAEPVQMSDGSYGLRVKVSSDHQLGSGMNIQKKKNQAFYVTIDLNKNKSPEFWNKYYNLAKNKSTVGEEKPHYMENKGGAIGTTKPEAPATPTAPTAPTDSTKTTAPAKPLDDI